MRGSNLQHSLPDDMLEAKSLHMCEEHTIQLLWTSLNTQTTPTPGKPENSHELVE